MFRMFRTLFSGVSDDLESINTIKSNHLKVWVAQSEVALERGLCEVEIERKKNAARLAALDD